ncbi:DUF481 domain-containing protein [Haliangium ochraceum]|uniref:DUF481 domain-containing protein n=1 Tax=Haliangium ochraceum TaxID=80816 RepID=UPI00019BAF34|nr:DUF481 domain-containing protein [Haliangium ochraceum]
MALWAGSFVALLAMAKPAAADIVNVISVVSVEAEEGLSGSVTGAVDFRRGNTTRLILSAAPVLRYRQGEHLFLSYGSGEYDEDNDTVRKIFGHARYRHAFTEQLTGEVFTQHETNPGRGQEYRGLVGVGPLYQLVDRDHVRLAGALAYMLEYELVDETTVTCPPEVPDCADDPGLQHRLSAYLTGSYAIADNLQVVETLYLQPLVTDPAGDFRLLNDAQISVLLTKFLAFNNALTVAYDSAPNPTINKNYDIALKSSITLQF